MRDSRAHWKLGRGVECRGRAWEAQKLAGGVSHTTLGKIGARVTMSER